MSKETTAVVQKFLGAFAVGDIEKALSVLHHDFVVEEAEGLPYAGRFIGHQGFLSLMGKMQETLEAIVESTEAFDAGEFAVGRLKLTFTSRKTGRKLTTTVAEIYTVKDGKIMHADVFYKDTKAVRDLSLGI